jgi:hypothetical protein
MSAKEKNMQARRFYIITGGTMVHVAPHFSLCAPAYGQVGQDLRRGLEFAFDKNNRTGDLIMTILVRTRMALGGEEPSSDERVVFNMAGIQSLETNDDLEKLLDYLVMQPETKGIILAAAVCDWQPYSTTRGVDENQPFTTYGEFGKGRPRLRTSEDGRFSLGLKPADKLIGKIRRARKDIFLVGFKATTGMSEQRQYVTGLGLLKGASCNLVFANDVHEHRNMVITPEEAKYHVTKSRKEAIQGLCEMIAMRSQLHFTHSMVVDGDPIPWDSTEIPANLRKVVDHCIARGAYKPFLGKTVGHFATRGPKPGIIYTSRRKSNFNELAKIGLLRIDTVGEDQVVAHGAKPSVGGQSQRIIFDEHPDVDCIVHAHVPLRRGDAVDPRAGKLNGANLQVREQRPYECGSMECGKNTSMGLAEVWPGIKAVMLDQHGPNICFSKDTDPDRVIEFIEEFWDLEAKTGGPVDLSP